MRKIKHRCSDALHLLADDTSLTIQFYIEYKEEWTKGSFYVIDKADRDLDISIRIKDGDKVIWSTMNGFTK